MSARIKLSLLKRSGRKVQRHELVALIHVLEAARRCHAIDGYCPLCEGGPPPYHNAECPLARFDFETPA